MTNDEQFTSIRSQWPDQSQKQKLSHRRTTRHLSLMDLIVLGNRDSSNGVTKGTNKNLKKAFEHGATWRPSTTLTFTSEVNQNREKYSSSVLTRTSSDIISIARTFRMNLEDPRFVPNSTLYQRRSDQWDFQTPSATTWKPPSTPLETTKTLQRF